MHVYESWFVFDCPLIVLPALEIAWYLACTPFSRYFKGTIYDQWTLDGRGLLILRPFVETTVFLIGL